MKCSKLITTPRYVSYDCAWRHKRRSRQASGTLNDLVTGKAIDFWMAVLKLPDHVRKPIDDWAGDHERVTYEEGYPQGLEVKIFKGMAKTLHNDNIIGVVKDNEHDPNDEIKDLCGGRSPLVDVNHNIKHFRNDLIKSLGVGGCSKFYMSLF